MRSTHSSLAKLAENGLSPAPEADRRTLIRRLTFDLIGLPPTPDEIDDFLADDRPDAYERLVDRLLASPHYGEHWARHWLDLVRYAESDGYKQDAYRDSCLALSRLRHSRVQQRQAVLAVRPGATRRRRGLRRTIPTR